MSGFSSISGPKAFQLKGDGDRHNIFTPHMIEAIIEFLGFMGECLVHE